MAKSSSTGNKMKLPLLLRYIRFTYNTLGRLFPDYFGNRAYEQWFTTTRFKTPAYELPAMDSARRETLDVNGIPVAVYIWQNDNSNHDKTLLFIHGWTGRGTQVVNYIEKLNAIGYRVISFDGPAHGNSPGKQTSALEMADVVLALNTHYGNIDAAITHSFGGMILAYAMSLGLRLERAVMICPPKSFEVILDNFQHILALPDSVMQVLIRKSYAAYGQHIRDAVNTINNARKLSCKGLILHDEDDVEISWHSGKEIADAWQGAEFVKTSGLGHRRIIHDDKVIDKVIEFLADTE
jgi:pimeloyl-ACP methyl ester carboxylesterase